LGFGEYRKKAIVRIEMSRIRDLHTEWMKDAEYRRAYDELDLAFAMIAARVAAGLTQEQLAQRMQTTQSVVARLENGRSQPSTKTLKRWAEATGTQLKIQFDVVDSPKVPRSRRKK
jgi:ribosome-binding protein aMBF1 (putative translation factor)